MTATRKPQTSEVSLVVFRSAYDPECVMCGEYIDIQSIGILVGDEFACPTCVDAYKPGYGQIVTSLAAIFDVVTLDLGPITTPPIVDVLRSLADTFEELAAGSLRIYRGETLVEDPFVPGEFCGVHINRSLKPAEEDQ